MGVQNRGFQASQLELSATAGEFLDTREPALRVGDRVRSNSDGPAALVVDCASDITISWSRGQELTLPRECVHGFGD
jgi:hypothetical protein